jgi:hypothetical protein
MDGSALVVGAIILLGLFGHLLNQQRASKRAADASVERAPLSAPAEPKIEAPQRSATPRQRVGDGTDTRKPLQAVYRVTHRHRLRDCHGTLTFTREGLRFESDEPQDSFAVKRDDVTIEGAALRIRDTAWRFEFSDGIRGERLFSDWKAGTLSPVTAP